MENGKEYVDNQIKWVRSYFEAEVKAIREAVDKVEKINEHYRASQNEWRGALDDQKSNLVGKPEFESTIRGMNEKRDSEVSRINEKLDTLLALKAKQEGKGSWVQYIPWILMAISIVLAIYANTKK